MRLRNLSWKQFEALDKEKPVIIPTGAIEVYGPHLPMGGDAIVADKIADMVADRLDLLVTPTIEMGRLPFSPDTGFSGHYGNKTGAF